MAEYYNRWDKRYSWLLNQPVVSYRFKVEILDHNEHAYGEITKDVSDTEHCNININKSQGIRRTCSLTMIDVDKKYIPSVNNPFWYNHKFKLYFGVVDNIKGDTYWFPQGVFATQDASARRGVVSISGVDKYAFLDGTLNVHMVSGGSYTIEAGVPIGECVRQTLLLEMGNGDGYNTADGRIMIHSQAIDTVEPLIDKEYEETALPHDIVLDEGQYLGDALNEIATSIGANIYYDVNGRLNLTKIFNDDIPFYYVYSGEYWHFDEIHETYIEPNANYSFDGCNYITVSTDNADDGEVASYTAINDNPQSPISISAVGYRGDKDNPVTYIPAIATMPVKIYEWNYPIPNPTESYKDVVFKYIGEPKPVEQGNWIKDAYYKCIGSHSENDGEWNASWVLTTLEELQAIATQENVEYCRQHANYLLLQKTCPTIAMTFKSHVIPHLDTGVIVTITDSYFGFDETPFLVESITYDGTSSMDISVVNIQWLPNLSENTTGTTVTNNGVARLYTLTYDIGDYPVDQPVAESGVSNSVHCVPDMPRSIEIDGESYHFSGWQDRSTYTTYIPYDMREADMSKYQNYSYACRLSNDKTLYATYTIDI